MNFETFMISGVNIQSLKFWILLLIFAFPGYSIKQILDKVSLPDNRIYKLQFIDCVYYSVIYYVLWLLFWKWVFEHKVFKALDGWGFLVIVPIVILTIMIVALMIGAVRKYMLLERLLKFFGFRCGKSIPTAWDYIYEKRQPVFVQITLVDGKVLRGWWNMNSFASSEYRERDIFLEQGYYVSKDGNWVIDVDSDGIYVNGKHIRYIEFRKAGESIDEKSR